MREVASGAPASCQAGKANIHCPVLPVPVLNNDSVSSDTAGNLNPSRCQHAMGSHEEYLTQNVRSALAVVPPGQVMQDVAKAALNRPLGQAEQTVQYRYRYCQACQTDRRSTRYRTLRPLDWNVPLVSWKGKSRDMNGLEKRSSALCQCQHATTALKMHHCPRVSRHWAFKLDTP